MPVAVATTTSRPRVLLLGESSGDDKADKSIRAIADTYTVPRGNLEEVAGYIASAVKEHGPFIAFGATWALGEKFPARFDESLLSPLFPGCKLLVTPGAGYEKTDVNYLTLNGCVYANSPFAVGQRTADGALLLTLAAMRGLTPQDNSMRIGNFADPSVRTLSHRSANIAIIGMGNIGLQLAQSLTAIGAPTQNIRYYNRRERVGCGYEWASSLDEIWKWAQVIVLTCPLTEHTRHLISRDALEKMRDSVIIVNVGRGPCIDEQALVDALDSGKVMRAALDVFENEPQAHPKLLTNPNVTLSPHYAANPDGMAPGMNAEVLENIIQFIQTGKPQTPVNLAEVAAAATPSA
ncbi:putative oxidoreductase [Naematelia encephala]|uniref:Putative oxidoreductase n=1 Tax=Naematelia encephala TaxID=71784 RepID=A0A1Y2B5L8_9TREE|nr:putative oxidoreductase [Naematelia encephala]